MEGLAAYRGRRHTRPKQQTEQQQENGIFLSFRKKTRISYREEGAFIILVFFVMQHFDGDIMHIKWKEFALVFLLV